MRAWVWVDDPDQMMLKLRCKSLDWPGLLLLYCIQTGLYGNEEDLGPERSGNLPLTAASQLITPIQCKETRDT